MSGLTIFRIEVEEASLTRSPRGLVSGPLVAHLGSEAFPGPKWTDAVVVVLGWWVVSLSSISTGSTAMTRLRFMEGPYEIEVQVKTPASLTVRFISRFSCGDSVIAEGAVAKETLLLEAIRAADRIWTECQRRGWSSHDVKRLNDGLNKLRSNVP